uniref:Ectonucleotide pyrophosphatase/phosphodiesterase 3 n=1 Tax=Latimeria chalumnae TaxID=7897 RepID=H2ZVP0_LATCH
FSRPPVILFSVDGFRAEYLHTWSLLMPNIHKLRTCGTHSQYMRAVYPTKTFPNHYSIVTGLYPESHGIIDNGMYDVTIKKTFSLSGSEKSKPIWWKGQPIWLAAMYQELKAGTFFWPGSDVAINKTFPNLYKEFDKSISFEERVFTVLQWLDLPKHERPDFYTLYIEEPDSSGHSFGPVSTGVVEALQQVDRIVGMLMDGLKQRNLHNCVNLILLADHGMEKTFCNQIEFMTDYLDTVDDLYMYNGPAARIRAKNVPEDYYTFDSEGIVKNLTCQKPNQHFKPYLTPNLPKRFHYANNIRIDKVHLYVDRQWLAAKDSSYTFCGGGNHGYDNEFKSMEALFLGYGPGFKFKTEVGPFENIELYNLMCDLLQITPAPNNGTHGSLNHLLSKPFFNPSHTKELSSPSSCPLAGLMPIDKLGCLTCSEIPNEEAANKRLNITPEEVQFTEVSNLPYGRPRVSQTNSTYCLLHQLQYVSGFSHDILMPLWNAYTVEPGNTSVLPPTVPDCLRADVRILATKSQKCSDYKPNLNITHGFLYPPNLKNPQESQGDALITSNLVPMYEAFKSLWAIKFILFCIIVLLIPLECNSSKVQSKPMVNLNFFFFFNLHNSEVNRFVTGTHIPIPTHYFLVLTSCGNASQTPQQCSGSLNVQSYLLPHRPDNSESCVHGMDEALWIEERVQAHAARVRDVELLTGLHFYQDLNQTVPEILQLKTFLPTFETEI